jgi:hypothetical protein
MLLLLHLWHRVLSRVRHPVVAVAAAPPENVGAALAGDGGGYRATGDANATWVILLVPPEHGRHRRTTAKFVNNISCGSYRGVGDTAKQGYERGEETASWGAVAGDCTAHSTKTHGGSGVLPIPFLLTGFVTNPHLPQFRHTPIRASDIVEFR